MIIPYVTQVRVDCYGFFEILHLIKDKTSYIIMQPVFPPEFQYQIVVFAG